MGGFKLLLAVDQVMKVCLHELSNDVDVVISALFIWPLDVKEFNDILVFEELEDFDLSEDTLCIDGILKSLMNPFNGDFVLLVAVLVGGEHMAVRAGANAFLHEVLVINSDNAVSRVELCFPLDLAAELSNDVLFPLLWLCLFAASLD